MKKHKKVWIVFYNFLEFDIRHVSYLKTKAKGKLNESEQQGETMEKRLFGMDN